MYAPKAGAMALIIVFAEWHSYGDGAAGVGRVIPPVRKAVESRLPVAIGNPGERRAIFSGNPKSLPGLVEIILPHNIFWR